MSTRQVTRTTKQRLTQSEVEKSLRLISQAWGRRQSGYVWFPYIDREVQRKSGKRRGGFTEGPAFEWPKGKAEIVEYLLENQDKDLYWTTSIFEFPSRKEEHALNEHALWADLDEADPRFFDDDYRPTIAWESSPGRFQCLWLPSMGNFKGASEPGGINQKLTYYVDADPSGWDTVQLLRIPGGFNHKLTYQDKKTGRIPKGKILWTDGPKYLPDDFSDLPEVHEGRETLTDALAEDIDGVDRLEVIARVKLKLNRTARDILSAREAIGDKSEKLWYLTRCLADVGCTTAEIVSVVRGTVWNKFEGRHDELRVLISEASKAIAKRTNEAGEAEDEEDDPSIRPQPQRFGELLKNIKRPKYIVQNILTEGACGFIAGEPKCYKSWVGLDLALSISTGADFLGQFRVVDPGPVLYIQEEDPAPTLKNRTAKIWVNKAMDKIQLEQHDDEPGVYWLPPDQEQAFDPNINAYIQNGFIISSEAWQLWLDDTLAAGMIGTDGTTMPYKLLIIDTLMMVAGDVDENRAQEMTEKVFKPLKTMARKHNCAVLVVHHMGKSEKSRPGQRMLGSVANHAWGEDSLYLSRSGLKDVRIDTESKTSPATVFRMTNVHNLEWSPRIEPWREEDAESTQKTFDGMHKGKGSRNMPSDEEESRPSSKPNPRSGAGRAMINCLRDHKSPMTTAELAEVTNFTRSTVHRALMKLLDQEKVSLDQDRKPNVWSLT